MSHSRNPREHPATPKCFSSFLQSNLDCVIDRLWDTHTHTKECWSWLFTAVTNIEKKTRQQGEISLWRKVHRLAFWKTLSLSSFQNLFCSWADSRENISTKSASECSRLFELKSVLINASDYALGKGRTAKKKPHAHTEPSLWGHRSIQMHFKRGKRKMCEGEESAVNIGHLMRM